MADDKTIKLIAKKLESNNEEEVLFTIKQIRNNGNPKILPYLIDLVYKSKSSKIKSAIFSLLSDLKDESCTAEIIKALENEKYHEIHQELLTTCWQSGLDYSAHLSLLVNMFVSRNFGVAFEALTILDSMDIQMDSEIIDPQIAILKSRIDDFKGGEKEGLLVELVHTLEKLKLQ